MNKGLTLSYTKQSITLNLDQSTNQTDSPILQFLEKQKKRNIFYIGFRVVAVQIQLKHAYYLIEVNEYGKKWIMRIRFSQLKQFKKNLCKQYQLKLTLSSHFVFNQLSPDNLKKRAQKIQSFFNQIGVQINKIQKKFYDSEFFLLLIVFIRVKMFGRNLNRLHRRRDPLIRILNTYNMIKQYTFYNFQFFQIISYILRVNIYLEQNLTYLRYFCMNLLHVIFQLVITYNIKLMKNLIYYIITSNLYVFQVLENVTNNPLNFNLLQSRIDLRIFNVRKFCPKGGQALQMINFIIQSILSKKIDEIMHPEGIRKIEIIYRQNYFQGSSLHQEPFNSKSKFIQNYDS